MDQIFLWESVSKSRRDLRREKKNRAKTAVVLSHREEQSPPEDRETMEQSNREHPSFFPPGVWAHGLQVTLGMI